MGHLLSWFGWEDGKRSSEASFVLIIVEFDHLVGDGLNVHKQGILIFLELKLIGFSIGDHDCRHNAAVLETSSLFHQLIDDVY